MNYSIQSTKTKKYWQAGEWRPKLEEATKYPSRDEAENVVIFRVLGSNVDIVENTTPFVKKG